MKGGKRVALSPEMAIKSGKATRTTLESWLSMQAKLGLWRAAGKPARVEVFGGWGLFEGIAAQRG